MKSATIILWILCLVVAVGASAVGAQGPAGAIAFWLAFVFLWTGIALRLRGSVLARWGGVGQKELLLGCGPNRDRRIAIDGRRGWSQLVTVDWNEAHRPDVVHDLEQLPYPFESDTFSEIHAYEVLEHLGQQGDFRTFFAQFEELWRILKPGGFLAATCPSWRSMWAWGDPSHRRVITSGSLVFLDREQYRIQVDGIGGQRTAMSDFRFCYRGDFRLVPGSLIEDQEKLVFVLQAVKPARWLD